ncbi:MAG: pitrilysin family protein [Bacteroidota bacterium]
MIQTISRFTALVVLLVSGLQLDAQNDMSLEIDFETYTLDNGLQVVLYQKNTAPIVNVSVLYHVGGKDSFEGRTGFAHFFEHLMFEGSKNISRGEYATYVQDAGGQLNAFTSQDITYYTETLPSNQLELGLWLESERMLHAEVLDEGIETQREVVKEERRQTMENQPYGSLLYEIFRRAFSEHPYQHPNIGYMEDINAATEADFQRFYATYYVPNNAVLAVAGDIDVAQTRAWIEKYFGSIPMGGEVPRVEVVEPQLTAEVIDTVYDQVQLPALIFAYRVPELNHPDAAAISVMNSILSQGQSSRLNRRLVDDAQLALQTASLSFEMEDPGLSVAFAVMRPGVDLAQAEAMMSEEVNKMATELISEQEYDKVMNQIETQLVNQVSQSTQIAQLLAEYQTFYGDPSRINSELDRYQAVSREDIRRVAQTYFNKDNRVVLYWLPEQSR